MLTIEERVAINNTLFRSGILIPESCVLLRLKDILSILDLFTMKEENENLPDAKD
uniref:Uncharacterized protein n=1 Tax=viral metagenome TaxID=1070528 RepID=A0A6M3JWT6_9ZZZZ